VANGGKFNIANFLQIKEILVGYDERSMQLPGLLIFLNFFTKFHNLIFDELNRFKKTWNVSTISFEAQKITTAAFQKTLLDYFQSVLREFYPTFI
jgi:Animal haem peroxidase